MGTDPVEGSPAHARRTEEDKVGFTQLDRVMCFTCVKNNLADAVKKNPPDCALSAEADIYACNARLLSLAGDAACILMELLVVIVIHAF